MPAPEPPSRAARLVLWLATAGGVGRSPLAPGSLGAALGIPLGLVLGRLGPLAYVAVSLSVILIGEEVSRRAEILLGRKDPPVIVIDEVAGMLVSLFLIPATPVTVAFAFVLFRVFDIWKPLPFLETLPGGVGVMADDLLAGVLANGVLHGLILALGGRGG